MGRVGRLNKIFNRRDGPSGPSGPAQRDFNHSPQGWGYDTAEVDAFRQEIRDTFLGVRQPLLTSDEAHDKRFALTRPGYKVEQVDAFFDEAEQRLAAMRPTYKGRRD
jgi:DivIVA domain-containing protein